MLTQQEFESILADATKHIAGDIFWAVDEYHSPARQFRAPILSDAGHPIFVIGWYNRVTRKLNYTIVHRAVGRIYALNPGLPHRNPDNQLVGDRHKHYWSRQSGDRMAYVPQDITEPWNRPVAVWRQFCAEANIEHRGLLHPPTPLT